MQLYKDADQEENAQSSRFPAMYRMYSNLFMKKEASLNTSVTRSDTLGSDLSQQPIAEEEGATQDNVIQDSRMDLEEGGGGGDDKEEIAGNPDKDREGEEEKGAMDIDLLQLVIPAVLVFIATR